MSLTPAPPAPKRPRPNRKALARPLLQLVRSVLELFLGLMVKSSASLWLKPIRMQLRVRLVAAGGSCRHAQLHGTRSKETAMVNLLKEYIDIH